MRSPLILASLATLSALVMAEGGVLQVSSFKEMAEVGNIDDIDYRRETFERYEHCVACWAKNPIDEQRERCGTWCMLMKELVE